MAFRSGSWPRMRSTLPQMSVPGSGPSATSTLVFAARRMSAIWPRLEQRIDRVRDAGRLGPEQRTEALRQQRQQQADDVARADAEAVEACSRPASRRPKNSRWQIAQRTLVRIGVRQEQQRRGVRVVRRTDPQRLVGVGRGDALGVRRRLERGEVGGRGATKAASRRSRCRADGLTSSTFFALSFADATSAIRRGTRGEPMKQAARGHEIAMKRMPPDNRFVSVLPANTTTPRITPCRPSRFAVRPRATPCSRSCSPSPPARQPLPTPSKGIEQALVAAQQDKRGITIYVERADDRRRGDAGVEPGQWVEMKNQTFRARSSCASTASTPSPHPEPGSRRSRPKRVARAGRAT